MDDVCRRRSSTRQLGRARSCCARCCGWVRRAWPGGASCRWCRSSWSRNSRRARSSASTAAGGSSGPSKRSAPSPKSFLFAGIGLLAVDASIMYDRPLPISAVLAGGTMAVLDHGRRVRFWWRMDHDRQLRRRLQSRDCERVIVFGAGSGGRARDRRDDAPTPRARTSRSRCSTTIRPCGACSTRGVKVVGDRHDMERVAAEYHATRASSSPCPARRSSVVLELSELATKAGLVGARAPFGARAARRRGPRRRHPRAHRARPHGPPLDRDRPRPGRVVPARQAGAW